VTIGNSCYAQEEANYYLYGVIARLCFEDRVFEGWSDEAVAEEAGRQYIKLHRIAGAFLLNEAAEAGTHGRTKFFEAGFNDSFSGITEVAISGCSACVGDRVQLPSGLYDRPGSRPRKLSGHVGRKGQEHTIVFDTNYSK